MGPNVKKCSFWAIRGGGGGPGWPINIPTAMTYISCTTSEYGSPDSSITDTTWTAEAETTNSDSDEWVLLDEDERKTAETPKTAETDNDRRVALNKVKKNLFGARRKLAKTAKKHGRRTGYSEAAEKAIKQLFRENINGGAILTSEMRWMRQAYPDISEHFEQVTDAQTKDKVWVLIRKRIWF